jgi:hypothetical protein
MAGTKPMDRKSRAKRKAARAKKRSHKAAKKASSEKKDTVVELNIDSLFDQEATRYLHGLFMQNPPLASIASRPVASVMPAASTPNPVAAGPSTMSPLTTSLFGTPTPPSFTAQPFNAAYSPPSMPFNAAGFASTPSLYSHHPTAYAGTSAPSLFSDTTQQQQPIQEIDVKTEFPQLLNSHFEDINKATKFHAHQRRKLIMDSGHLSSSAMDETTRRNAFDYQNNFFTNIKNSTSLPTSKKKYFEFIQPRIYTQWKSESDPNVDLPDPIKYSDTYLVKDLKKVAISHNIMIKSSFNKNDFLQALYDNGLEVEIPPSASSSSSQI